MRPCACTTSSHITPNVTQFEPRLCVCPLLCFLSHNEAIAVPLLQAYSGSVEALYPHECMCRSDLSCVMFDMGDEISDFDTKYIYKKLQKTTLYSIKTKTRHGHCIVYCTISSTVYTRQDILYVTSNSSTFGECTYLLCGRFK